MTNQDRFQAACKQVCDAALAGRELDLALLARDSEELQTLKTVWGRADRLRQRRLSGDERAPLHAAPWEPEQQLREKYTVVRKLGGGGMGEVYLVRRNRDGRELAAKRVRDPEGGGVLDPLTFLGGRRKRQAAMLEEIIQSMQLPESPYVLRCQFFDIIDNGLVLFTEYARHGSLANCLEQRLLYGYGPDRDRFNELAWQTLMGLAHLHESRVVHQDIKPENVLITDLNHELRVRIADFGIARELTKNPDRQTWEAPLAGLDRRYASPEQLAGRSVTAESDVYSWALTMLAATPQTKHETAATLLSNRKRFIAERIALVAKVQGATVADHLQRALVPEPESRPTSAELLGAFRSVTMEAIPVSFCHLYSEATFESEDAAPRRSLKNRLVVRPLRETSAREQLVALVSQDILDRSVQDGNLGMSPEAVRFLRSVYAEDDGRYQEHLLKVCNIKARRLAERGDVTAAVEVLSKAVEVPDYHELSEKQRYGLAQARMALLLYDHAKGRPNAWEDCLERARRLVGNRGDLGMRELVNQVEAVMR